VPLSVVFCVVGKTEVTESWPGRFRLPPPHHSTPLKTPFCERIGGGELLTAKRLNSRNRMSLCGNEDCRGPGSQESAPELTDITRRAR
jgi:hypothetical protein